MILKISKDEFDIKKLEYGNKIIVTGIYEQAYVNRNYKGFNYKEYLKTKKIYGTINVEKSSTLTIIKQNNCNIVLKLINNLTNKLNENIEELLPEQTSGIARGILLGNSKDIEKDIKQNFKDCNLSHMLAVSGTHLSYLIVGLNLILNKKILGIRNVKIITIIIIIIFIIITNLSPSVVRAGITAIIYIVATLLCRKQDAICAISFALIITLINNPFSIFNIGMQLSYLGTFGIILFYDLLINKKQNKKNIADSKITTKIKTYIKRSITITASANILIMPITIYNFNVISLNFVISNLIAGPILGLCIILGLVTLIISLIFMPFARIISIVLNITLHILLKITQIISQISISNITVRTPYILTIISIYIIIYTYKKSEYMHIIIDKIKFKKILVGIIIVIICFTEIINVNITKDLTIHFIDVGQGDSCLIYSPYGKTILVDGGGARDSEYDVGENILLPYLLDRRIIKLDYIIISHFDSDHCRSDC